MPSKSKKKSFRIFLFKILSIMIWGQWFFINFFVVLFALLLSLFLPKKKLDFCIPFFSKILMYTAFIFPVIKGIKPKDLPFPAIFVANHVSIFDLFISGSVFPGSPRGLELKKLFKLPLYGWLISRYGNIPIEPGNYASVKQAYSKLYNILKNKERNLVIMPEGTRTITGKVGKFRSSAFALAKKAGVPIIPVVFKGLFEINNKTSIIIKPGKFDLIILEPQYYTGKYSSEDEMAEHVRQLIIKKLEE